MGFNDKLGKAFASALLTWDKFQNTREMPWKGEKDPYKVWLSEVILQQTKVEQGLKYYESFLAVFPDLSSLAKAPDDRVFKLWQGLGYYSRCRNLIATARYIDTELNGSFPADHASILKLKGIGAYTAAAIGAFAFNLPIAVLDGNVYRVLSRIFAIEVPIDTTSGKKLFTELAQSLLPAGEAARYNQAIMDFGAVICKPVPQCLNCFFSDKCLAYSLEKQNQLPLKEKKIKLKERWLNYFVFRYGDEVLIHQRTAKGIWQNLYEFFLAETKKLLAPQDLVMQLAKQNNLDVYEIIKVQQRDQRLTHQLIHFNFLEVELNERKEVPDFFWVPLYEIDQYAFPKSLQDFIATVKMKEISTVPGS